MTRKCDFCGYYTYSDDALFCTTCGGHLPEVPQSQIPVTETEVQVSDNISPISINNQSITASDDALFCTTCGAHLPKVPQSQIPVTETKLQVSDNISSISINKQSITASAQKTDSNTQSTKFLPPPDKISHKSKIIAIVLNLCVLVGLGGLHRFYVGKTTTGIIYLFTLGGFGIGSIVDMIYLCTDKFTDKDGKILK